jgi:hypothetical protein
MKLRNGVTWGLVAALVVSCSPTFAALPPSAYPDPEGASEILDIEVLLVHKNFRPLASRLSVLRYRVEVKAKVLKVIRSHQGLKAGTTITIRYEAFRYTCPDTCGPSSFPLLTRGEVCRAHLVPTDGQSAAYELWGAPYSAFSAADGSQSSDSASAEKDNCSSAPEDAPSADKRRSWLLHKADMRAAQARHDMKWLGKTILGRVECVLETPWVDYAAFPIAVAGYLFCNHPSCSFQVGAQGN